MKKNSFNIKTIAIAAAVVVVPTCLYVAQACSAADDHASPLIDRDFESCLNKFISHRLYNRIDATPPQREKLDQIWTTSLENTRPDREELRHGILDLSSMIASDNTTDEQITEKAHELRALHEKVQDARLQSLLKARKVLTQEQRQKLNEHLTEMITGGSSKARRLSFLMR